MRKLASIQKIISLEPIEGRDRIELATVLGWKVIVQKGQFKVGDLCVYCEIDSLLPVRPEFEFLRERCYSSKYFGFRIQAMKMGGVYSEGICFPMSLIDDYRNTTQLKLDYLIQETTKKPSPFKSDSLFVEGHDITEMLGIKKYDPEAAQERQIVERKFPWWKKLLSRIPFFRTFFYKKTRESFPTFVVPKTDETRVQVLQKALDANVGLMCFATEKLDGQSGTWFWYKKQFYVCSRNFRVVNKNTSYWRIAGKYDLEKLLKETNIAIQGEIIGPGIQGNKYGLREIDMYVFNVWDIKTRKTAKTTEWIATEISLKPVPVIGDVFLSRDSNIFPLTNDIRALVEMAKGKSALADIPREGIVIRSLDGKPYNVISNIFSFKVINPEFLLRYGDEQ